MKALLLPLALIALSPPIANACDVYRQASAARAAAIFMGNAIAQKDATLACMYLGEVQPSLKYVNGATDRLENVGDKTCKPCTTQAQHEQAVQAGGLLVRMVGFCGAPAHPLHTIIPRGDWARFDAAQRDLKGILESLFNQYAETDGECGPR